MIAQTILEWIKWRQKGKTSTLLMGKCLILTHREEGMGFFCKQSTCHVDLTMAGLVDFREDCLNEWMDCCIFTLNGSLHTLENRDPVPTHVIITWGYTRGCWLALGQLWKWKVKPLSCVQLCDPMHCRLPHCSVHGIFQQEYWSGLPFPSPEDLPDPGIEPGLPHCKQMLYHLSHQGSPGHVVAE